MKSVMEEIKSMGKGKITFADKFYKSNDVKTVMGEVPFKEILFLEYRDTEAGSNPREYNGLQKTNLEIIKSLLMDYENMFRFLHSGMIISLTNAEIEDDRTIRYSECCLTNGNQTRFIILIITLLKLFLKNGIPDKIIAKEYNHFIKSNFNGDTIETILKYIKLPKVNQVIGFLNNNSKYREKFNSMDIQNFLNSRIRVQVNLINSIIRDLENEIDDYSAGTLIAEANNDTQKVKADDIFGNKRKDELAKYIFNNFLAEIKDIEIEYRMGEVVGTSKKVHILTLLRPIIPTGILTKEQDVYQYSNKREPVYRLFEKLIQNREKEKAKNAISAISKIIPIVYSIRNNYLIPQLGLQKKKFMRNYEAKAINGDLDDTTIRNEITFNNGELTDKAKGAIRKIVNYNVEHIIPVLIYRIRRLFKESNVTGNIELTISDNDAPAFFNGLIESIYTKYVDLKLKGTASSLTDIVRSSAFYQSGEEAYIMFKNTKGLEETDYIDKHRFVIK